MSECLAKLINIVEDNEKKNWNELQMSMSIRASFVLSASAQGHTNRPSMAHTACFDWNGSFAGHFTYAMIIMAC